MTTSDQEIRAAIAQQAGEWVIANQAGSLDEEESAAFLAWLKASPMHVREYLAVARIAHHLPAVVGQPQVPLETFLAQQPAGDDRVASLPGRPERRSSAVRHSMPWLSAVAASVIALAAGTVWWAHDGELLGTPKSYRTAHGEQSVHQLPDGSVVHLDTDSAVTVHYSGGERLIELDRGQALFEVAHEASRRFRVVAGIAGAIAVGTRFNVYLKPSVTEITVAEGEIAVFAGTPSWLRGPGGVPAEVQRVPPGY